jgi:hypothetical protein
MANRRKIGTKGVQTEGPFSAEGDYGWDFSIGNPQKAKGHPFKNAFESWECTRDG